MSSGSTVGSATSPNGPKRSVGRAPRLPLKGVGVEAAWAAAWSIRAPTAVRRPPVRRDGRRWRRPARTAARPAGHHRPGRLRGPSSRLPPCAMKSPHGQKEERFGPVEGGFEGLRCGEVGLVMPQPCRVLRGLCRETAVTRSPAARSSLTRGRPTFPVAPVTTIMLLPFSEVPGLRRPQDRCPPENACPIAPVVDIVFSRWTTPILWTLHEYGRHASWKWNAGSPPSPPRS